MLFSIVRRRYVRGSKNSHKSGRSITRCRKTSLEQLHALTWIWTAPPVNEDRICSAADDHGAYSDLHLACLINGIIHWLNEYWPRTYLRCMVNTHKESIALLSLQLIQLTSAWYSCSPLVMIWLHTGAPDWALCWTDYYCLASETNWDAQQQQQLISECCREPTQLTCLVRLQYALYNWLIHSLLASTYQCTHLHSTYLRTVVHTQVVIWKLVSATSRPPPTSTAVLRSASISICYTPQCWIACSAY